MNKNKQKKLNKLWQEFLAHKPDDFDLTELLTNTEPQWLQNMAWEKLLEGKANEDCLYLIIRDCPSFRKRAWKLLRKNPTKSSLLFLVRTPYTGVQEQAAKILLSQKFSGKDLKVLRLIFDQVPSLQSETGERLLEHGKSTKDDLAKIAAEVPHLRRRAWEKLNKQPLPSWWLCFLGESVPSLSKEIGLKLLSYTKLSREDLIWIIENVPALSLKEKAAQKLLKITSEDRIFDDVLLLQEKGLSSFLKNEKNDWSALIKRLPRHNLRFVISDAPALRKKTWQYLLELKPDNEELRFIIENVPPLKRKAQSLLVRDKETVIEEMRELLAKA